LPHFIFRQFPSVFALTLGWRAETSQHAAEEMEKASVI
jgi:hypothetical protein